MSSSTRRRIQINPELMMVSKRKRTMRKTDSAAAEESVSSITKPKPTRQLQAKLLNRAKEHSNHLFKQNGQKQPSVAAEESKEPKKTDEFTSAIQYLTEMSKKKQQKVALHNKTVRSGHSHIDIEVDLPPELQLFVPTGDNGGGPDIHLHEFDDEVPYGCLKGGRKKTYRQWKSELSSSEPTLDFQANPNPNTNANANPITLDIADVAEEHLAQARQTSMAAVPQPKLLEIVKPVLDEAEKPNTQTIKQTIRRKFTLGKSDRLRKVGVLLKNKQTRRNILDTQKELKKTDIGDVRKYLRQHGIVKAGTACPQEVLRKTFEAAMLTGEVTNTNHETVLGNLEAHV